MSTTDGKGVRNSHHAGTSSQVARAHSSYTCAIAPNRGENRTSPDVAFVEVGNTGALNAGNLFGGSPMFVADCSYVVNPREVSV